MDSLELYRQMGLNRGVRRPNFDFSELAQSLGSLGEGIGKGAEAAAQPFIDKQKLAQTASKDLTQEQLDLIDKLKPMVISGSITPADLNEALQKVRKDPKDIEIPNVNIDQAIKFNQSKKSGGVGSQTPLTPDAIDKEARLFLKTGSMSSFGMANAAARNQVKNRVAEIMKEEKLTPDELVSNWMDIKAKQGALSGVEKTQTQVKAFEGTALKNLDLAQKISGAVDRTGSPAVNRWLQAGKKKVLGDVNVAKFDTSIRIAINEAARVLSTTSGGSVTTDSARADIEAILNAAQTPEQVTGIIETLKADMKNRDISYDEVINDIKDTVGKKVKKQESIDPSKLDQSVDPLDIGVK